MATPSTAQSEKFAIANLHRIDPANKPATYVAASKLLDTPNVNTYDASVKVYVSEKTPGVYETLSFGIQVGSAADDNQDADENAWTCFDNFKIEYLGTPPNVLILDEDQEDGAYINAQAADDNKKLQKSVVYLHRTMNTDKWNSLVLPINLNVGQVKSIFGDQVHISEFKGAYDKNHPQRIIFDPITANRTDPDAIAIEAGKLYLVKPTADGGMPTGQPEKKFTYNGKTIKVTNYYTIVGVTFKQKNSDGDYGLPSIEPTEVEMPTILATESTLQSEVIRLMPTIQGSPASHVYLRLLLPNETLQEYDITAPAMKVGGKYELRLNYNQMQPKMNLEATINGWTNLNNEVEIK